MDLVARLKRMWRRHDERLEEQGLYEQAFADERPGPMLGDAGVPLDPHVDEAVEREAEEVEESREEGA